MHFSDVHGLMSERQVSMRIPTLLWLNEALHAAAEIGAQLFELASVLMLTNAGQNHRRIPGYQPERSFLHLGCAQLLNRGFIQKMIYTPFIIIIINFYHIDEEKSVRKNSHDKECVQPLGIIIHLGDNEENFVYLI